MSGGSEWTHVGRAAGCRCRCARSIAGHALVEQEAGDLARLSRLPPRIASGDVGADPVTGAARAPRAPRRGSGSVARRVGLAEDRRDQRLAAHEGLPARPCSAEERIVGLLLAQQVVGRGDRHALERRGQLRLQLRLGDDVVDRLDARVDERLVALAQAGHHQPVAEQRLAVARVAEPRAAAATSGRSPCRRRRRSPGTSPPSSAGPATARRSRSPGRATARGGRAGARRAQRPGQGGEEQQREKASRKPGHRRVQLARGATVAHREATRSA